MDSRQVIARFEAERQALAMMDHVNIARVFDGGTTEAGRPYFVMELVHGVPITKYCDDNHLTPRERLELFVPVCQAIQHAHQKGIIHRDIKPSNVMVTLYDGKPVPKVIDFGVAKATEQKLTERTLFTQYGTMVGTLEYMSPEQAEMSALGVDTRSDIYSLGVLLYELLTGSTPLTHKRMKEAAYGEILRMIKEEEPPRPSTRLSDSGEALASISAQRKTDPAKLSKLVRGELDWIVMKTLEKDRNRRYETANGFAADVQRYLNDEQVQACPPTVGYRLRKFARRNKRALVTASVIGVAVLLAVGTLGWMVSDRAARQMRTAGEVNQFLQRAEALYADNKLPEAVAEVEKARGVLEAGSGDEELGRQVRQWHTDLDTAAKLEENVLESHDLTDRDRGYADYARVFRDYGIDVEALPVEEATARVAASHIKFDLVLALENWASRLRNDPRRPDAAGSERLRAIARAADPDPWRQRYFGAGEAKDVRTLRELADGADLSRDRTRVLANLGSSLAKSGDVEAAVAFLRKAQRQHPGDFLINSYLAGCLTQLKQPMLDEVIAFRRVAVAVRPQSAWAHNTLGVALKQRGRLDEAVVEHREAVRLRPRYPHGHYNLGHALGEQNKLEEAVACYRKAIELDPSDPNAHNNLGNLLCELNRLDEAVASCRKAIELDPKRVRAHYNLGNALRNQNKLDEAIASYKNAIEIDPKYVKAHNNLGLVLYLQNKLDEAIASYKNAIEIYPNDFTANTNLGLALRKQGNFEEAVACYRRVIEFDPKHAAAHLNLGLALMDQAKVDDAIDAYREAIRLNPGYARAYYELGVALMRQGKVDDAVAAYRKSSELDPRYAQDFTLLGDALGKKGWDLSNHPDVKVRDHKRGVELGKKAVELAPQSASAWQLRGWIEYRAGNWKDSIQALEKSCKLQEGGKGDAFQWLFLAMAHWQLGDKESARKWYDKAIELERVWPEELRRFRAEASELMGLGGRVEVAPPPRLKK